MIGSWVRVPTGTLNALVMNDLVKEITKKFRKEVPISMVISYLEEAYLLGMKAKEEEMKNHFKFVRLEKDEIDKLHDYKFIPNPYNGGDDDFIIVDTVKNEYTYGEDGELPFCDIISLNRRYSNMLLKDIIKEQFK